MHWEQNRLQLLLFVAIDRQPIVHQNTAGISRVRVPAPKRPVDAARPFAQVVYQAAEPLPVLLCLQTGAIPAFMPKMTIIPSATISITTKTILPATSSRGGFPGPFCGGISRGVSGSVGAL